MNGSDEPKNEEKEGKSINPNSTNGNGSGMQGHNGFDIIRWVQDNVIKDTILLNLLEKYNNSFQFRANSPLFFWLVFIAFLLIEFTYRFVGIFVIVVILLSISLVFIKGVGIVDWDPKYLGCKFTISKCE